MNKTARTRHGLDRRSFLRGTLATGAAVALGTPLLDVMLDEHGAAHAGGEPLPSRFGLWFFGNGVRPEHWVPTGTGAGSFGGSDGAVMGASLAPPGSSRGIIARTASTSAAESARVAIVPTRMGWGVRTRELREGP